MNIVPAAAHDVRIENSRLFFVVLFQYFRGDFFLRKLFAYEISLS
jgi:hypothetical protein